MRIVAFFLGLLFAAPASAHHDQVIRESGSHWYDPECCSDKDCKPVPPGFVEYTGSGWLVLDTGQFIPELDANGEPNPRVKNSKDNRNHICRPQADPMRPIYTPAVVCYYRPPPGL